MVKQWLTEAGWRRWLGIGVGVFTIWFIPWILVLPLGTLVYFPYDANGDRYVRVTGPLPSVLGADWVAGDEIPDFCRSALVAAEDTLFFEHHGLLFDLMWENFQRLRAGKHVRVGGSTITQQLVKNAFLSRDRSILRKLREAAGALFTDALLTKNFQITWYLNVVEFGPKVYGIRAAAQHYFKTSAGKLSPSQCAALMAVLPNPIRWGHSLRKGYLSEFLRKRFGVIVYRVRIMGIAAAKDLASASRSDPFGGQIVWPTYADLEQDSKVAHRERDAKENLEASKESEGAEATAETDADEFNEEPTVQWSEMEQTEEALQFEDPVGRRKSVQDAEAGFGLIEGKSPTALEEDGALPDLPERLEDTEHETEGAEVTSREEEASTDPLDEESQPDSMQR